MEHRAERAHEAARAIVRGLSRGKGAVDYTIRCRRETPDSIGVECRAANVHESVWVLGDIADFIAYDTAELEEKFARVPAIGVPLGDVVYHLPGPGGLIARLEPGAYVLPSDLCDW